MLTKMVKAIFKRVSSSGFTLIELLAVMSIVATLAAIVSVAVTGSGQTSRDTQVREDGNSARNAVADFFDDQPVTELFESLKVTVKTEATTFADVTEQISNKFPELFITDLYFDVFHVTVEGTTTVSPAPTITVNAIKFFDKDGGGMVATDSAIPADVTANTDYSEWTILRSGVSIVLNADDIDKTMEIGNTTYYFELDTTNKIVTVTLGAFLAGAETSTVGTATVFEVDDLLTAFNALDWHSLDEGGFSTTIPESVNAVSTITETVSYPQYLWLLEKSEEKGSTGKVNSRDLAVFVLTEVIADTTNTTQFNLNFRRLT
ncbi:MAG: type II secretion system protein [Chloroflexi bacterium]|nr:type II secretion system protein [Chloroflexota bacterium]